MKIIAQVLAYNEVDCIAQAIEPWINVVEHIDTFEGSFYTLRNLGYSDRSTDGTTEVLHELAKKYSNICLHDTEVWNEPILRNNHLFQTIKRYGREDTCLFILDADEIYSQQEVEACVNQVASQWETHNTWWVNFKNYINTPQTYYLGFRAPRFFKLKTALGFDGYNSIAFSDGVKQTDVQNVLPKHYSWLPLAKARQKIKWQTQSLGWCCSFREINGEIVPNDGYYTMTGKQKPTLYTEK